MKIKYIDYGIGNRVGNTIYLNKKLKEIPGLHDAIVKHEYNHSDNWNFGDFLQDVSVRELRAIRKQYYWFILSNPSTWINFSPVMLIEGKWCFDLSIAIVWVFFLTLGIFLGLQL